MALFDFLRRKDEKAIPEPGTPEFEAAVHGSALPDEQSVAMGDPGWTSTDVDVEQTDETIDLRGTGAREAVLEVLRQHGIDPDKEGQTIDASDKPGLTEAILGALFKGGVDIPNAGGFGGAVSPPPQDNLAQLEHLAKQRDSGELSEAEFEAQKRKLLGS
ncbi:MAG: SHOCT domain-containing protein [Solirubrobacterales bacterium]